MNIMNSLNDYTHAVVLFSGGQDSTTCLYWAKKKFKKIIAVGFNYKQKHIIELEQAKKIAEKEGVTFRIIDIDIKINEKMNSTSFNYIEIRNSLFILIGSSFAKQNNINNIIAGMCKSDFESFPDCRITFLKKIIECANLSLSSNIKLHLPLINLSKAEIWKLDKDLGIIDIIVNDTHTDYNGDRNKFNEWGYGVLNNQASIVRAEGFHEAKIKGWI